MKIIKNIINVTIRVALAIYLVTVVSLRFDPVQRIIGSQVAQLIAHKLGTRVEVGKVDLGFLNRIIIDNVTIYDQGGRQMLTAARLTAKIDLTALADNKIEISSAQIFSAHLSLYRQNAGARHNFQFVIDSLASGDSKEKTPPDLRVNSLIMRHSSIAYDQYDKARTPAGLNPAHIAVTDINSHVILKRLTNDSISLNIKKLSLREQSGLVIDRLALAIEAGRHGATMDNFELRLPHTRIEIDRLAATYSTDSAMRLVEGSLRYTAAIKPSRVALADLAFIAPRLKGLDQKLYVSATARGTDRATTLSHIGISTPGEGIALSASAAIAHSRGSVKAAEPAVKATEIAVKELEIAPEAADRIVSALTGSHIPQTVMRLGTVSISGTARTARGTKAAAHLKIRSAAGVATLDARLADNDDVTGKLTTDGFDLGYLLDNGKLGSVGGEVTVSGNIARRNNPTARIRGNIAHIEYNAHTFKDMALDISHRDRRTEGRVSIDNNDIALDISGSMEKGSRGSHISVDGQISAFAPQSLNITPRYGNARFSAGISADLTGSTLNDLCGTLDISGLKMVSETDYYHLDRLSVTSRHDNRRRLLNIDADFGNIELAGRYDYASLWQSFVKTIRRHMPTMPGLPQQTGAADSQFSIGATLTRSDWMEKLLGVDLELNEPLGIAGHVDGRSGEMALRLRAPSLEYNGKSYAGCRIDMAADNDRMTAGGCVTQANSDGRNITYCLEATAAGNRLATSLKWRNNATGARERSGLVKAVSEFYTGNGGQRTADIRVEPSHISINGARWDVAPASIRYRKDMITVSGFSIRHGDQHLTVNGRASKSAGDSLVVDLKDVDVEYVLDLVNFHSVNFSGMASGKAYVRAPFGSMEASASLKVRGFEFEHGRMGTLNAAVAWNAGGQQIDIHGICNDGPDAMTFIDGYVSPKRKFIDLDINAAGTRIDFMQSFTRSFAEGFTGRASGRARLSGPLSTINLTGELVVDGEAKIKALNCKYRLENDTVRLVPDEIELRNAMITDAYGNRGYVSGFIHHKHLTRLSYDLSVSAHNLLAYDFREFDGATFCGTVFADGNVDISGRSGELTIDVSCTPQKNSVFAYNTSSPDAITNQEFIRWNDITPAGNANGHNANADGHNANADDHNANANGHNAATRATAAGAKGGGMTTDIYINFLVNCTPDATLRLLMDSQTNDYITLNGSGTLRASYYNKGAFKMFGTYLIDHGTYSITIQNIIKKYFVFNSGGTIVFGGDPFDAALNMQAVYTVNGVSLADLSANSAFSQKSTTRVNCLMNIGGLARQPQVAFDLDMPTMDADEKQMVNTLINTEEEKNQQVLYLLGIGRFYPQTANNQGAEQASRTALAMQSILSGTVSGQINSLLNTVIRNDNWNFGANIATGDEGWNNAEYEGTVNGRMLNDRLLFNGEFGYRDNANTANTSFIGDFNIQYNLTPNGGLSVKVYNETNDRYFTKSSLNTQGVGFVVKRNFANWRDLLGMGRRKRKK